MLEVIKTKEMKSTTRVEGMLVQMSDKNWYAITRVQPPRFGWYILCAPSTTTGKTVFGKELFMHPTKGKPEFEEGIKELTDVLNGIKEPRIEKPNYNLLPRG